MMLDKQESLLHPKSNKWDLQKPPSKLTFQTTKYC